MIKPTLFRRVLLAYANICIACNLNNIESWFEPYVLTNLLFPEFPEFDIDQLASINKELMIRAINKTGSKL